MHRAGEVSHLHCENLVQLMEVKLTKWGASPPNTDSLLFLTPELSTLSLQQFVNCSLGFPTLLLVPMEVSTGEFLFL